MIEDVVSVVDQTKLDPDVVNTDEPQLSVTVTTGAAGAPGSINETEGVFEAQPSSKLTVYDPAAKPVIV